MDIDLFGMKYPITDDERRRITDKILTDELDDLDDYDYDDFGDYAVVREPLMESD